MNDIDYTKLDGNLLRQFLAVYDAASVTLAAQRIGIGQSAVSHSLDRLRGLVRDPLFVRQGRGITPTDRAHVLAEKIRAVLPLLEDLLQPTEFSPLALTGNISIAADDFERELFGQALSMRIWREAPNLDLQFVSPGTVNAGLLRSGLCDLMISPAPPDGTEFMQRRLFSDSWTVFYSEHTHPPFTKNQFCERPHAKVVFSEDQTSTIDRILADEGMGRRIALRVGSFLALPNLLAGTDLITTLPSLAKRTFMRSFPCCPPPFPIPEIPFYLVWHSSRQDSAKSKWLRYLVTEVVDELLLADRA